MGNSLDALAVAVLETILAIAGVPVVVLAPATAGNGRAVVLPTVAVDALVAVGNTLRSRNY